MTIRKGWLWGGGVLALVLAAISIVGFTAYSWTYRPGFLKLHQDTVVFYSHTGEGFHEVYNDLVESGWIRSPKGLQWLAQKKSYPDLVKPGRYVLESGWSGVRLIDHLRSGKQEEVNLVFNTMRTFERLAGVIGRQIEPDSAEMLACFSDTIWYDSIGMSPEHWFTLYLPDTYKMYWTTTPRQFMERMKKEYDRFWNEERRQKAASAGLTPDEVVTLASIVQEETFKTDEMATVAGVYMNRLKIGMRLQADPTVIFAMKDKDIRRVLHRHLRIDSPYNTYKIKGLPPGPIRIPSRAAIEATLNFEKHRYLYFCAKDDFSGYHAFASSYSEHLRNARKYQRALDAR